MNSSSDNFSISVSARLILYDLKFSFSSSFIIALWEGTIGYSSSSKDAIYSTLIPSILWLCDVVKCTASETAGIFFISVLDITNLNIL